VLELCGPGPRLLSAKINAQKLTSVATVHPSSHSPPRGRVPCTSGGSIVKQSPGFMSARSWFSAVS
jgi:hypothetical protein